jgi:hypothetical protein
MIMAAALQSWYVSKAGRDGWLRVKLESGGEISLPQYLKVQLLQTQEGRDHFQIMEGPYKGKKASVSRKSPTESYLITGVKHEPAGSVRFNCSQQALWYASKGPFNAFSGAFDHYTQVPAGKYELAIPDAPHRATRDAYYPYTDYHKTWFRIGLSLTGERYLHVGEISEGCVTVRAFLYDPGTGAPGGFPDLPRWAREAPGGIGLPYPPKMAPLASWNELYEYLIIRRASDQSVGTLIVE